MVGGSRFLPSALQVRRGLGQAAATWTDRASSALSTYRGLVSEIDEVASELARQTLLDQLGGRQTLGSPEYKYAIVLQDLTEAASSSGAVDAYTSNLRRQRVEALEAVNAELSKKISDSKVQYGERSASEPIRVPDRINWIVPAGVGIGSLILTLIFFNR